MVLQPVNRERTSAVKRKILGLLSLLTSKRMRMRLLDLVPSPLYAIKKCTKITLVLFVVSLEMLLTPLTRLSMLKVRGLSTAEPRNSPLKSGRKEVLKH